MERITTEQLRHDTDGWVDRVRGGETLTVTRDGNPVARLVPMAADGDVELIRPATRPADFSNIQRVRGRESTADILDYLRGESSGQHEIT